MKSRLAFLDTLRGVAIMAVFLYHVLGYSYGSDELKWIGNFRDFHNASWSFLVLLPVTFGSAGVALFFVISGFCIHLSWVKHPDWRAFAARRFWRIYPPYLFALVLCSTLAITNRTQFLSHLFLVHNFGRDTVFGINGAFWSVAIETQFYALFPLIVAATSRIGWGATLAILGVVEFATRTPGVSEFFSPIPQSPLHYWFSWAVGAWLADRYYRQESLPRLPVAGLLAVAIASKFYKPTSNFYFPLYALTTAAWISNSLSSSRLESENWMVKHLRAAGKYSYSLYLIHVPIIILAIGLLPHNKSLLISHAPIRFCILLALWPVVLWLSRQMYRFIEKPSMSLRLVKIQPQGG